MIIIGGIILVWVIAAICIHKGGIILTIASFIIAMVVMITGIGILMKKLELPDPIRTKERTQV